MATRVDPRLISRWGRPFHWREAGLCAPAIPVMLGVGLATGSMVHAAVAAGAALSVGFGASRDLRGRRWGAMLAAAFGMALAGLAGTWLGQFPIAALGIACLLAAVCAALALYDEDLWWVSLQIVIAYLVADYYAGPWTAAIERAATVLGGGVAQIVCVVMLSRLFPTVAGRLPAGPPRPRPSWPAVGWHMVRAMACVGGSLAVAWHLGLANSYWAPMTAMIVIKPGLRDTGLRGLQRIGGTMAGGIGATGFALAVAGMPWLLVAGVAIAATAAFALQKAHYATLTSAITAAVVLLITLAHGAALENAEHRLAATLLGGIAALACAWIAPRRPTWVRGGHDRLGAARPGG